MNTSVSDDSIIVNVQGIRTVSWGFSKGISYMQDPTKPWHLTIAYKNNNYNYYYKTESEVLVMFDKIRKAMDEAHARRSA